MIQLHGDKSEVFHSYMSILEVSQLKKVYVTRFGGNRVEALRNVNFSVERGEYVAIMGESGSTSVGSSARGSATRSAPNLSPTRGQEYTSVLTGPGSVSMIE